MHGQQNVKTSFPVPSDILSTTFFQHTQTLLSSRMRHRACNLHWKSGGKSFHLFLVFRLTELSHL